MPGPAAAADATWPPCTLLRPPSSVVVNTQGRESGGSWFETCSGVWYPRRRPCGVAINTLVDLNKLAGETPSFYSVISVRCQRPTGGSPLSGPPPWPMSPAGPRRPRRSDVTDALAQWQPRPGTEGAHESVPSSSLGAAVETVTTSSESCQSVTNTVTVASVKH